MNQKELNRKQNYDKIVFRVAKGGKDKLKKEMVLRDKKSVNSLIIEALEQYYNIDLS